MRVLVYAEVQGSAVSGLARELITAAWALAGEGGEVETAVLDAEPSRLISGLSGATRAVVVRHPSLSPYNPEAHASALERLVEERSPDLILIGYTSIGLDLAPMIAIRRNIPLVSYCIRAETAGEKVRAESQMYGGKLISVTTVSTPAVLAINPSAYREAEGAAPAEAIEIAAPDQLDHLRVSFVSAIEPDPSAVDITRSERLLCVGRGIGSEDVIEEAREVAALLGGELVGSRPVIDAGWLPKERQVGKSGRKVKPRLYLALGVSGAPEHLEGMSSSELIVAVNSDPRAPIFDHAHVGACVDATEILPALKERLAAGR